MCYFRTHFDLNQPWDLLRKSEGYQYSLRCLQHQTQGLHFSFVLFKNTVKISSSFSNEDDIWLNKWGMLIRQEIRSLQLVDCRQRVNTRKGKKKSSQCREMIYFDALNFLNCCFCRESLQLISSASFMSNLTKSTLKN